MIPTTNIDGTFGIGTITMSYEEIVSKLGKEHFGASGDDKTLAEWGLLFNDGTVATLYNWKNGKNYDPIDGLDLEEITEWNIGGNNNPLSEILLKKVLKGYTFMEIA